MAACARPVSRLPALRLERDRGAEIQEPLGWRRDRGDEAARHPSGSAPALRRTFRCRTQEEFFRHKLPAELFDAAGNEAMAGATLPEAQPPNWLGNNAASGWIGGCSTPMATAVNRLINVMKSVTPAPTPATSTRKLSRLLRAPRRALARLGRARVPARPPGEHGWKLPLEPLGRAGFCRMFPELNVKPAFIAFATLDPRA